MSESTSSNSQPAWRSLYPFASHTLRVDAGGQAAACDYNYVDEGEGRPLLMVHGNPTWSFYWHPLISGLRDRYRCLAVDHIGCGLSSKPQVYEYRLENHIANLVQLIDELDLRDLTLLVHDWGGAIGLGAALERPDRFSRLVVFNTAGFPPPYVPLRIGVCRWPLFGPLAIRGFNAFARAALTMAVEDRGSLSTEERAGLVAPYDNWANRIATLRFVQDIPSGPSQPTWRRLEQIEQGLSRFRELPIQIIWGMRDWCFRPECLERFVKVWPQALVDRRERVGHYVVLEDQQHVLEQVSDFLSQTDSPVAG